MNPRHEKTKPHLVRQYANQIERIEGCWVSAWFSWDTDCHDSIKGTFFSERFKK